MTFGHQQEGDVLLHVGIRHAVFGRDSRVRESSEEQSGSEAQLHASEMDANAACAHRFNSWKEWGNKGFLPRGPVPKAMNASFIFLEGFSQREGSKLPTVSAIVHS